MTNIARLPARGVIEVAGEDRVAFLQGLVSNDVAEAAPGRAVWAALLTPQGKYLADFFIFADGESLFLDVEAAQIATLLAKMSRFRLRAKATLAERADLAVYAAWDGPPGNVAACVAAPDPRLPDAGFRLLSGATLTANANASDWDAHRIRLGLPDGTRDMEPEKSVLLEAGFDELHGVSWTKGCYMGQELTARTHYRGLIKRRLVPVAIDGPIPPMGTPVFCNGSDVGTMRSAQGAMGMAILRLEAVAAPVPLDCAAATLRPRVPAWLRLPGPTAAAAAAQAVT